MANGDVPGVPQLGEALTVWALYGLETIAVLVTYSRLPSEVLYNVDSAGDLAGGLSRMVTVLNYPLALGAIALAAVAGGPRPLVWTSVALSALVAVPGVVDQDDLEARWINALPVLGVVLALALTTRAAWGRRVAFVHRARGDWLRLALGAALVLLALPWFAAESGFYFPGDVFLGEELPPVRDADIAAVHLGFHHGTGGVLLVLTALLLSRVRGGRALRGYLSLMLAYGLANAVQDGWNEQLWKRGTVDTHLSSVLRPNLTWGWVGIVAAAAAIYALWFSPSREQ